MVCRCIYQLSLGRCRSSVRCVDEKARDILVSGLQTDAKGCEKAIHAFFAEAVVVIVIRGLLRIAVSNIVLN